MSPPNRTHNIESSSALTHLPLLFNAELLLLKAHSLARRSARPRVDAAQRIAAARQPGVGLAKLAVAGGVKLVEL